MTKRPLRPGEKALWERIKRTVTPLEPAPKTPPKTATTRRPDASKEPPKPAPPAPPVPASKPKAGSAKGPKRAAQPSRQPPAAIPRGIGDLDRKERRKLARDPSRIEARIDLHGMTQAEAHGALHRFVLSSAASGRRVVLVITGKGHGGEGAGILRRAVPYWLSGKELQRVVAGYGAAHPHHGGAGAIYVRLKSPTKQRR